MTAAPTPAGPRARLLAALGERRRRAAVARLGVAYSPDAAEVEGRETPAAATWLLWAVIGLVAAAVLWASLASVDRVVVARGRMVTTASKIVVQPLETSAVKAIPVLPGQVVEKGQLLVALDPTFAAADERGARAQAVSLGAEIRRLEAELSGAADGAFSDDPAEEKNQREVFLRRKTERETMLRAYDEQVRELEARAAKLRAEIAHAAEQRAIAQKLVDIRQELNSNGNGSLVNLLEAQTQLAADKREAERLANELVEAGRSIESTRAHKAASLGELDAKAAAELQTARRELSKAEQAVKKQERISDLVELRAPSRAMVIEVAQRSVGSVVRDGEPLVTLVPLDSPLEIDAVVDTRDIAYIRVGDGVRVKLEALPYQKHGVILGRVSAINADSTEEERGSGRRAPVYKARIAIERVGLRQVPPDFALLPGMESACEIKVGKRRVASYFLYPLIRALDSSLREP
jgi:HlyD family secretion protein